MDIMNHVLWILDHLLNTHFDPVTLLLRNFYLLTFTQTSQTIKPGYNSNPVQVKLTDLNNFKLNSVFILIKQSK
jgi:hypothetical protein